VGAVQAEQDVEVDGAAGLVFGDLAVGDPDRGPAVGGEAVSAPDGQADQVPFDVLLGAPPQFPGAGVPHHVRVVVIAVRAQRLAEPGITGAVPPVAGGRAAVRAGSGVAAGVARFGLAPALAAAGAGAVPDGPGVDRAEGRGGEGGEHRRVGGHGGGDAFAAGEPGADEVEGVTAVGVGAAGAGGDPPVAARLVHRVVGQGIGVGMARSSSPVAGSTWLIWPCSRMGRVQAAAGQT
jgi:hypothetical protein